MPCTPFKLGDTTGIICTRGRRPKRCCACHLAGGLLCDWKVAKGKTCSAPICPEHALEVGDDKHLCPTHQQAYAQWKAQRQVPA